MKIPLPRLPPPQELIKWLRPVESLSLTTLLLIDLPPPWIGLLGYPSGTIDRLDLDHETYRLAYYSKSIELSVLKRSSLDQKLNTLRNTVPLLWRGGQFNQYRPASANITKKVITQMTTATKAAPKATKPATKSEKEWIVSKLVSEFTNTNGSKTRVGFVRATPIFALEWMKHNPHNRPFNWSQANTLMENYRSGEWIGEANLWVIDWNDDVADGQHRAAALVLAFGTENQIGQLLLILASSSGSMFSLSDKAKKAIEEGNAISSHVPISGFQNWYTDSKKDFATHGPTIMIPVVVDGNPKVCEKADQDALARTGADQLARNSTTGSLIANLGQNPKLWQEVIRHIWLRAQPATISARKEGARYSTLRKGGKLKPDDFPKFMILLKDSLTKAMGYINELGTYSSPLSLAELIATVTLAVEGGYKEDSIKNWLKYWAVSFDPEHQETVECYGPVWALRNLSEDTEDDRRKNRLYYVYAASFYLNAAEQGLDPAPDDVHTIDKLLKVITKDPEQYSMCRLNGLDSVGDMRFVSAALKKKLRIETKNLTQEEREKIGLTEKDLPAELAKELLAEKKKGPKAKPPVKAKVKAE